jgi:hypothetical protein
VRLALLRLARMVSPRRQRCGWLADMTA